MIATYSGASLMVSAIVGACGCLALVIAGRARSARGWSAAISETPDIPSRIQIYAFALLFIAAGMAVTAFHRPSANTQESDNYAWCYGVVDDTRPTPTGTRMEVRLSAIGSVYRQQQPIRNIKAFLTSDSAVAQPGDCIVWRNRLIPIVADGNRQDDIWPAILRNQGILYRQHLSAQECQVTGHDRSLAHAMTQARSRQRSLLERSRLSEPAAALTSAIITGDRQPLAASIMDNFRLTGLSHILALSGLHIGILASLMLVILTPVNLLPGHSAHKARWIAATILLWAYALFTGLGASVVRACVMATVLFLAIAAERPYRPGNALGLAAFIILLFDPMQLFQAGFQLSFLITALILATLQPLGQRPVYRKHRVFRICRHLLLTVIAMIGSWLLTAFYFHSLPLGSLPWNLLASIILPIYFIAAVLYSLVLYTGCDPSWMAAIVDSSASAVIWCGNHPEASVPVWLNGYAALGGCAALASLVIWLHVRSRKWLAASATALAVAAGCVLLIPSGKPKDGFIVQNYAIQRAGSPPRAAIRVYADGRDSLMELPSDTTLLLLIHNRRLLLLDSQRVPADNVQCHLLLIGPGFGDRRVPAHVSCDTILLLPTVYPSATRRRGKTALVNLREYGPYPSFYR